MLSVRPVTQLIPLVGEMRSGLVLVDADGFIDIAKRMCGAIWESVTATDA